ncbi:hypothetical protein BRC73_02545 [Halobacteriales archaeon QH_7_66_37]|nr:MAG: hypothetical protein BRC73_02545 [Halobacteriales archaeon QH_7_66_37]
MWVTASGDVEAQGAKNFVETVDTEDGEKEVVYTATESGTAHTEESGVGKLDDGRAEIDLPEHFEMVTDGDEPLVVQTTPYGGSAGLKVVEHSTDRLVVVPRSSPTRLRGPATATPTKKSSGSRRRRRNPRNRRRRPTTDLDHPVAGLISHLTLLFSRVQL